MDFLSITNTGTTSIYLEGPRDFTINNSTFNNNAYVRCIETGARNDGRSYIRGCTFKTSQVVDNGVQAILLRSAHTSATFIEDCTFTNYTAIYSEYGNLTVSNTVIDRASRYAVYQYYSGQQSANPNLLRISNCQISNMNMAQTDSAAVYTGNFFQFLFFCNHSNFFFSISFFF